jgi:hypothetical protein
MSAKGVTDHYFVSLIEKVDYLLLINQIHKNIVEEKIKEVHSDEARKVILHLDSAPSHKTPAVYQ